ncbi:hypothetical protein CHELA40_11357 [Chelatococcus asaccharovorans]|nr:hypothetical protein CHELA40_11357 [Chelatococcus asaccharovorans]CAH1684925.1 hypothetical protein CHELA17_64243 [Chelatococcus asaccharovorans]
MFDSHLSEGVAGWCRAVQSDHFHIGRTGDRQVAIEAILALPTVDGIFAGPSDLSLTRGRGRYRFDDADQDDLLRRPRSTTASRRSWRAPRSCFIRREWNRLVISKSMN